jgi:hypothetical protein
VDSLNPQAWHDFFSVAGTAAAALLGLVLVAISLRIEAVEAHPILRNRARAALQTLGGLLLVSLVALVPDINAFWFGTATLVLEVIRIALTIWGIVTARQAAGGLPPSVWVRTIPNALSLMSLAGAISLILDRGPGIYLLAAAFILTLAPMLYTVWGVLFAPELRRSA